MRSECGWTGKRSGEGREGEISTWVTGKVDRVGGWVRKRVERRESCEGSGHSGGGVVGVKATEGSALAGGGCACGDMGGGGR